MKKFKLRTIILLETFLVITVCMGFFVIYTANKIQKSIEKEKYNITDFYIRNVINEMDSLFNDLDNTSYLAYCKKDLVKNCKSYNESTDSQKITAQSIFYETTSEIMLRSTKVSGVILYDTNQQLVYSHIYHPSFNPKQSITDLKYDSELIHSILQKSAQQNTKSGFVSFRQESSPFPEIYIYEMRELRLFENYEQAGYIVLLVPISIFEDFFENNNNISNILLLNEENTIIYESTGEHIGISAEQYFPDFMEALNSNNNGYYSTTLNGTNVLTTGAKSSYNGWKFITIQSKEDVYSVSYSILKILSIVFIIMLVLSMALIALFISRNTKPLNILSQYLCHMDLNHPGDEIHNEQNTCIEIVNLTNSYNSMLNKIKNMLESEYKSVIREKEYSLALLNTQIKPHFLYNTLDTIRMSSIVNGDTHTADMILCLSDFFRRTVTNKKIILLEDEFSQIESYLSLLQIRYDELTAYIHIDDVLRYIEIPSFVLQPLVENAFLHGLKSQKCTGTITVTAKQEDDELYVITVQDDGIGASEELIQSLNEQLHQYDESTLSVCHIGLKSVNWRLHNFFGPLYHMDVSTPVNGGFCVKLYIHPEL